MPMKPKYNFFDVLDFYEQNELNETFANEPTDKLKISKEVNFLTNTKKKDEKSSQIQNSKIASSEKNIAQTAPKIAQLEINKVIESPQNQESAIISNVKNITSTSHALAELAKKNQINFMENKISNADVKNATLHLIHLYVIITTPW